jgi:hypothetical protein
VIKVNTKSGTLIGKKFVPATQWTGPADRDSLPALAHRASPRAPRRTSSWNRVVPNIADNGYS